MTRIDPKSFQRQPGLRFRPSPLAHGIAMVIAMIVIVSGPVGNFIVPLMCGARDMAFPRLNALSIWLLVCAVPPLILSLLVGGIRDGWSVYQPLNSQAGPGMTGGYLLHSTCSILPAD